MIDLRLGDCIEVMKGMEANSVDAIVTDPPYGLEFMGKEWDKLWTNRDKREDRGFENNGNGGRTTDPYLSSSVNKYVGGSKAQSWHYTWAVEALRVAKPGAHLLAFGGTRTFHRLACAIEDAGWEIRDTIGWLYGSGFPKSHNLKDEWQGWGTALKPAWEPVIVARKPVNCTVAENVLKWGTGCINIDGCRVGNDTERGDRYNGKPSLGGSKNNYGVHHSEVWNVPIGRWPANLIHDGSDEVMERFPETKSGERKRTHDNQHTIFGFGGGESTADSGSAARFFYCAKASKRDRDEGLEGMPFRKVEALAGNMDGTINKRTNGNPSMANNFHPTVKPTALMQYLCRLVTPPGGVILDPFMGSGSTGKAAVLEGFNFIGIELDPEYFEIAEKRIAKAMEQPKLEI